MKHILTAIQYMVIAALLFSSAGTVAAAPGAPKGEGGPDYQTGFTQWRGKSGGFSQGWNLDGVVVASYQIPGQPAVGPALAFAPTGWKTGTDTTSIYNGGAYEYAEATSPVVSLPGGFALREAIASWNADTTADTWIEIQLRAQVSADWTKWYSMGVWAQEDGIIKRHSISAQGDGNGYVAIDTFVLSKKVTSASALQIKARLFRTAGSGASPMINNLSLAYSNETPKKITPSAGNPADWNTLLAVPECSQMVYPDGGNVWCSPTSTSMVLSYWGVSGPAGAADCEIRVRAAVAGVYDWNYDGHGNWPFNTAYAAAHTTLDGKRIEGYVARYNSLTKLEPWVKAGVPVVMSIAWGKKELTGAAIPSSNGHLVVLVGFDGSGNPIVNDPAAGSNEDVQRTYIRSEFESIWLTYSGGTTYLIYPEGHPVPEY